MGTIHTYACADVKSTIRWRLCDNKNIQLVIELYYLYHESVICKCQDIADFHAVMVALSLLGVFLFLRYAVKLLILPINPMLGEYGNGYKSIYRSG